MFWLQFWINVLNLWKIFGIRTRMLNRNIFMELVEVPLVIKQTLVQS